MKHTNPSDNAWTQSGIPVALNGTYSLPATAPTVGSKAAHTLPRYSGSSPILSWALAEKPTELGAHLLLCSATTAIPEVVLRDERPSELVRLSRDAKTVGRQQHYLSEVSRASRWVWNPWTKAVRTNSGQVRQDCSRKRRSPRRIIRSTRGFAGGRDRRRSGDPTLFRRVLCQLSYSTVSASNLAFDTGVLAEKPPTIFR